MELEVVLMTGTDQAYNIDHSMSQLMVSIQAAGIQNMVLTRVSPRNLPFCNTDQWSEFCHVLFAYGIYLFNIKDSNHKLKKSAKKEFKFLL